MITAGLSREPSSTSRECGSGSSSGATATTPWTCCAASAGWYPCSGASAAAIDAGLWRAGGVADSEPWLWSSAASGCACRGWGRVAEAAESLPWVQGASAESQGHVPDREGLAAAGGGKSQQPWLFPDCPHDERLQSVPSGSASTGESVGAASPCCEPFGPSVVDDASAHCSDVVSLDSRPHASCSSTRADEGGRHVLGPTVPALSCAGAAAPFRRRR